jgi:hypothetical protein
MSASHTEAHLHAATAKRSSQNYHNLNQSTCQVRITADDNEPNSKQNADAEVDMMSTSVGSMRITLPISHF